LSHIGLRACACATAADADAARPEELKCIAMKTTPAARRQRSTVRDELLRREPVFHRLKPGATRADLEAMTDAQFCEVGASGRHYGRDYVLDLLEKRFENPGEDIWEVSDFHCLALSRGTYLVTYTLLQQKQRVTRRSSIWRRRGKVWQIVYHQGTVVED
jgi:hypothetical protein